MTRHIGSDERAEFAAAFGVSRETLGRLDRYVALLAEWNARFNLIGPLELSHIWLRHIADSYQLLSVWPNARTYLDFGSGAGLPGLVLACGLADTPGAKVTLIESSQKKATFLNTAAELVGAPVTVRGERIEDVTRRHPPHVEVVTARAVAPLDTLLDYAAPLLRRGAQAVFPKGRSAEQELTEANKHWSLDVEFRPSRTDSAAHLVLIRSAVRRR